MISGHLKSLSFAVVLIFTLSGCGGGRPVIGGDPQLRVLPGNELPTPGRIDATVGAAPYYVGPFDKLEIDVFGIEELSEREFQADGNGQISFPLVGIIDVNGKTPGEIESELTARLRRAYVRDPQVAVNLKEVVSRTITVEGEVEKPGLYPVVGRLSLMSAIAKAEGTGEFSNLEDVVIFRTVAGQRYAALYNLDAIRHGAYPDPEVYASDIVMVGESRGRRLFKDILAAAPALLTPLVIAVDRFSN